MVKTSRALPRGIALVRVETPLGGVVVCSNALTDEEARVARAAAFQKVSDGARAVVLSMIDVALLLREAAA